MAKLTTVEGIGEALAARLKRAGVGSVEKLLEVGSSGTGRRRLADASGMDPSLILRFVNHADLMRIKGVGGQYSELLEAAGVDTVAELARRNAGNLHERMTAANEERPRVRSLPTQAQVQDWIDQAKDLPRAVEY